MRMAVHAFGRCPGLSRCPLERGLLYVRGLSPFLTSQSSKPGNRVLCLSAQGTVLIEELLGGGGAGQRGLGAHRVQSCGH